MTARERILLIDDPPEPGHAINELWAWIATHKNGGEGIIASILPNLGSTPLVSSKRRTMEAAGPLARRTMEASKGMGPGEVVGVRLRRFKLVSY